MKNIFLLFAVFIFAAGAFYSVKNRDLIAGHFQKEVSTISTPSTKASTDTAAVNKAVSDYLPKKIIAVGGSSQVFCSHHLYGYDEFKESGQVVSYQWVYCEEYFLRDGKITMGQGVSFPIKIYFKNQNGKLTPISHEEPLEGGAYENSIEKMFPERLVPEVLRGYDITKFSPSPEEQAKTFYSLK